MHHIIRWVLFLLPMFAAGQHHQNPCDPIAHTQFGGTVAPNVYGTSVGLSLSRHVAIGGPVFLGVGIGGMYLNDLHQGAATVSAHLTIMGPSPSLVATVAPGWNVAGSKAMQGFTYYAGAGLVFLSAMATVGVENICHQTGAAFRISVFL